MSVQWEALVRALRTFVQGLIATALVAAYDAVTGALASGAGLDWQKLGTIAVGAALSSAVAYAMNALAPRANAGTPDRPDRP
jgi:type IV secretory pathway VirB2 component (pilin)